MRNVRTAVSSCHRTWPTGGGSLRGRLGSLRDDQRKLGATIIDMGGGTTSIATFSTTNWFLSMSRRWAVAT